MELPAPVEAAADAAAQIAAPEPITDAPVNALVGPGGSPDVTPMPRASATPAAPAVAATLTPRPSGAVPAPPRVERPKLSTLPPPGLSDPAPWAGRAPEDPEARRAVEAELGRQLEEARAATMIGDPKEYSLREARQLIAACERELARLETAPGRAEPHRNARLHYEIARQYEFPLADLEASADHYKRAHSAWADFLPAVRGARRVIARQGNFQALMPLFDAEIRLSADPRERARLYVEKGLVLEERLGQARAAREAYRAAVAQDPLNPVALGALEAAERAAGAWAERDGVIEKLANVVGADARHRATLVAARARSAEVHQRDEATAIELYRSALNLDPHATGALPALKRLLYAHKRWGDLVSALKVEARLASDPHVRALALYRAGRIESDRLGQLDHAIVLMEDAVRSAPSDVMILEALAHLYDRAERYDVLVQVLERIVTLGAAVADRVGMLHRIGWIHEEKLGDADAAIRWYVAELEIDASSMPALHALSRLYREREQWPALIAIHTAEANGASDPVRRAAAYAKVAELYEMHLHDAEQAAVHHAHALGVEPGYPPSFQALSRLYTQAGNHRGLIELYERMVDLADDGETKITYLFKIGRLYEDALGAPSAAVTAYRRILDVDSKHIGALHAIQRSAERASQFKDLVEALELEARCTGERKRVVALHHRAGEVLEQGLNDLEAALQRYRKVVELDPRYEPALVSLARCYDAAGRWQEVIEVYEQTLALEPKGLAAAALWYKIGEVYDTRLGREDKALEAYRKAVELEPAHSPSVRALERSLGAAEQWLELVRLLERSVEREEDEVVQARALFRAGEIYEHKLSKTDKAMTCYDSAVAASPGFRPPLDARARLLAQQGAWQKLVDVLGEEAAHAKEPDLAVAALLRQAELLRDELEQPERASASFEAALTVSPDHLGALVALAVLYAAAGKHEELARVLAAQVRVMTDPMARIAALKELARVQGLHDLGGEQAQHQTYAAILNLAPRDPEALLGLEGLALRASDTRLLAQIDAQLVDLETGVLGAAYRTRLAESLEAAGEEAALRLYREAIELDPDNFAATRGLTRLARRNADASQLEAAAEQEARLAHDMALAGTLLVEASALQVKAGQGEAALRALRRALEISPEHDLAARSLRELMLVAGRIHELIDSLVHAAQATPSKERAAVLWGQVAELQAETLRDVPAAVATLQRVVKLAPGHQPTLMRLADLYASDAQWAAAVDTLRRALPTATRAADQAAVQLRLAIILHDHLSEPKAARDALNAVLMVDPGNAQAIERLLAIQIKERQYDAASKTAQRLVDAAPDQEVRARALGHRAELERRLGHTTEAIVCYREAVEAVGFGQVAERFRTFIEQKLDGEAARWEEFAQALAGYLESGAPSGRASETYFELGRVMSRHLGRHEQAAIALERALAQDPSNAELHSELASALERSGRIGDAISTLRKSILVDVGRVESWRELARAFSVAQRSAESVAATSAIVALGAASEPETAAVMASPARAASCPPGSVDHGLIGSIGAPGELETAVALLASFHDGLPRIYGTEFERYGLTSRDRIGARAPHPLRQVVDRVAAILNLPEVDLFVHRAHQGGASIELTETPSILVPEVVASYPEPYQVFLMGRVIVNLARRIQVVDRLPVQALEVLMTAAARNASSSFGSGTADEEYLNAQAKKVNKSLPWGRRRPLEEAAEAYVAEPVTDFSAWSQAVRTTAARAALIVCDDLPAAVEVIRRTEGDLAGAQGELLARSSAMIADLMQFWVSEAAFAARRRLNLL